MPKKPVNKANRVFAVVILILVFIAAFAGIQFLMKQKSKPEAQKNVDNIPISSNKEPIIDYSKIDQDKELKALMRERKAQYGVDKGVDIIAKSHESIKIGDSTVSMQEILEKIRLKSGDIVEKDIKSQDAASKEKNESFGIHVVQPGENIWNIHFTFLKDYFDHKGVHLAPRSDEPLESGSSSGVGKILKFSEHTVNIYNIRDHRLDVNLNLIFPLTKVVVYNMDQLFAFLDLIDYKHVNRIQFDGETLWMPSN
jgi:hypothetical protein